MTLPRHIANELGIVMNDEPKKVAASAPRQKVIEVIDNDDGSKTVLYFGKSVGHIYEIGIKNQYHAKYRAISNFDDVRHFESLHLATSFLMASNH